MFKRPKLTTKITFNTFFIIIISITIIGYIGFRMARNSIYESRISALQSITDLKVDMIETFFKERVSDIKTAQDYYNIKTNLPIMTQYAHDRTNPDYTEAKEMLDSQLKEFQNVYGYIDIMLVSSEGKIVYVTNENHLERDLDHSLPCPDEKKIFEETKKGVCFTDVFINKLAGYKFEMMILAPVNDFEGRFIGCIALEIDMFPIYEFIQDVTGLGETGETLIAQKVTDGALFINTLRHDKEAVLKRKVIFGEKAAFPIQEAVLGRNGHGLSTDYRGEEVLAVWRHIPSLNWGLVSKIDKGEAFSLITRLRRVIILVSLVILAFALTGAFFFSRTITRPVKQLSDIAYKISNGDLSEEIKIRSTDEIGILARSFEKMRIKIALLLESIGEAKKDWETTFHSVKDIIVIYDTNCNIIRYNNELLSRLNARHEDIVGKKCYEIFYSDLKERNVHKRTCEVINTAKTRKPGTIEKDLISLNGTFLFSTFPRFNDKGEFTGIVQILKDVTEQKRATNELLVSYKMASLGRLTAGVFHEVLNPVNIISSHVQLLLTKAEKGSETEKDLKSIQEEIARIVKISDGLLRFSRKQEPETKLVKINDLLEKVITVAEPEIKLCNVTLVKKLESRLPQIIANADQLRQVFLNMITNAKDAMPVGGTITVSTQRIQNNGNSFERITFNDTGLGISKENVSKIFDPFFTTKEEGKGTGLGLSLSYGIIENHGGKISVKSEKGKGTTFNIDLPVCDT